MVKEFRGEIQLSTIKDRTEIVEIDDLNEVAGNEVQLTMLLQSATMAVTKKTMAIIK